MHQKHKPTTIEKPLLFKKTTGEKTEPPQAPPPFFRMSGQLVEEKNKLKEHGLGLKESLRHLKEINDSFKI